MSHVSCDLFYLTTTKVGRPWLLSLAQLALILVYTILYYTTVSYTHLTLPTIYSV